MTTNFKDIYRATKIPSFDESTANCFNFGWTKEVGGSEREPDLNP